MGKVLLSSGKQTNDTSKTDHTVRCTICGKTLTCSSENTAPLVDHLRKCHPNVHIARFPELKKCEKSNEQIEEKSIKNKDEDTTSQSAQQSVKDDLASGDHKEDTKSEKKDKKETKTEKKDKKEATSEKKHKKLYETTVEVWQCSRGPVVCKTCGECQTPVIRVRKKSLSESSAAAMCLLGCWPFCFLPYMMCGGNSENLTDSYCSKCGHLLPPINPTEPKTESKKQQ